MKTYKYGMLYRGFSIGCQPKQGLIEAMNDETGKYYSILTYSRELTDKEVADFELEKIIEKY